MARSGWMGTVLHGARRSFLVLALFGGVAPVGYAEPVHADISWQFRDELYEPVKQWADQQQTGKNARTTYSRTPRKVDDATWQVGAHVHTAESGRQIAERYMLTVGRKPGDKRWSIVDAKVVDTYVGLFRETGVLCRPFESFAFDREGMRVGGGKGTVCETYIAGQVSGFAIQASSMSYDYAPPKHAAAVPTGRDFQSVHKILVKDHSTELPFAPAAVIFDCDIKTCEELLASCFQDLTRPSADERAKATFDDPSIPDWAKGLIGRWKKERNDHIFSHFEPKDEPGNRRYRLFLARELNPLDYGSLREALPGSGVMLEYDSWKGWEVAFWVFPPRGDIPEQLGGQIYGYYTEETARSTDPEVLERRDDLQARWIDVQSIRGTVVLALDEPTMLRGNFVMGMKLKQNVRELPFSLDSIAQDPQKPPAMFVNDLRLGDQDLTWVRTGDLSGRVILPEELPAGSKISLHVDYSAEAIQRYTPSYAYLNREGWMPFVSPNEFVDELEMTVRAPAKFQVVGVGRKVSERVDGDVLITQWKAERPLSFPTVIFGRYKSDTPSPKLQAKRADGSTIAVQVHVDDSSFADWDIRTGSLRPIADQAANSLNLYRELTGLDYPFGELNLVNDPRGVFGAQAPGSMVYVGSPIFRGEGAFSDAGASKFLKSVVAHEVGHQWWGGQINNANRRNYWFVESLAEYFSAVYVEGVYGWDQYLEKVEEWRREILDNRLKASVQNATTLFPGEDPGARRAQIYAKGPYAFHVLRETFRGEGPRGLDGADKKFFDALVVMSRELAGKGQIVTLDIQNAAERALCGVGPDGKPCSFDLDWFFDQWIRGVGMPQFSLQYTTRRAEDNSWIVEGRVLQRLVVGSKSKFVPLEGQTHYRGRTTITVAGADRKEYPYKLILNGPETPFAFKVPVEPRDVAMNKGNEMLALDPLINQSF